MTFNRTIDENIVLTIGKVVDNVTLEFTKTATLRTQTLIPTVNSSSNRWLNLTLDTTQLQGGEYNLRVLANNVEVKKIKVTIFDYKTLTEYKQDLKYTEYNGNS